MFRAGRSFSIFKLFKWFLGAVFLLWKPLEVILEAPGSDFSSILETPAPLKTLKNAVLSLLFVVFMFFSLVFAQAAEKPSNRGPREANMSLRSAPSDPKSNPGAPRERPGAARE